MLLRTPGDKRRSQAITETGTKRINERRFSLVGNSADALVIKKKSKMDTEDLQAMAEYNILGPDQWAIANLQNWQGLDRLSTAHLPTNKNLFGQTSTPLQGYRQALMRNNSEYEHEPLVTGVALEAGLVRTSNSASPGQMRLAPTPSRSILSLNNPNSTSGSLSGKRSATPHSRNHAKQVVDPCDQDLNAGSPAEDCRVEIASSAQVAPEIPVLLASSPVSTPSEHPEQSQPQHAETVPGANLEQSQHHQVQSQNQHPTVTAANRFAALPCEDTTGSSEDEDMIAAIGGSEEEAPPRSTDETTKEQNLTNEVEDAGVGMSMLIPLPDLNIVPSSREQTIERNRLEKLSKKEKKREQKKEQRRRRLERTRHLTGAETEDGMGVHAENASSSDEGLPSANMQEQRRALIDPLITKNDNKKLSELPGADELWQIVKDLPSNKSPGEDGIPVEVLQALWDVVGEGCLAFVREAWTTKRIGRYNAGAIIKLIPKNERKETLRNWQPISLLNLAYKLVGRILAKRMKEFIPRLIGEEQTERERARDLHQKLQNRMGRWASCFLTWASKVTMLQHVLRTLPVYQLLGLGLLKSSFQKLEAPCRAFLWGTNADHKTKTALVSWDCITKFKRNGGLQVRPFQKVSEALKIRYAGRLLSGESSDWAHMIRFFVKEQMTRRAYCREVRQWTAEEGLLLLPRFSIPRSETANSIMNSWFKYRSYLQLEEDTLVLPESLTLRQLLELLKRYRVRAPFNDRVVYPVLKKIGVTVLANLVDSNGRWIKVGEVARTQGLHLSREQSNSVTEFQDWLCTIQTGI
ncbi:hypothetical protein R1flu_002918 [Riccia fluitans]|uniref:Uncharacterized protein n=1 Tax=Riccia fluitans TaxID=41844 RepID=A0ABD1Y7Q0_9MARC